MDVFTGIWAWFHMLDRWKLRTGVACSGHLLPSLDILCGDIDTYCTRHAWQQLYKGKLKVAPCITLNSPEYYIIYFVDNITLSPRVLTVYYNQQIESRGHLAVHITGGQVDLYSIPNIWPKYCQQFLWPVLAATTSVPERFWNMTKFCMTGPPIM